MILGHLHDSETYSSLTNKLPALAQALAWIQNEGRTKEPGKYALEQGMSADVQLVATQPREQGRFESHRKFIDVQFCYEGSEVIEWAPANLLQPINQYNPENDVQHYSVPAARKTALRLMPDTFAVFFPGDAHLPKVADSVSQEVRKVVVKVPIHLLD